MFFANILLYLKYLLHQMLPMSKYKRPAVENAILDGHNQTKNNTRNIRKLAVNHIFPVL